MTVYLFCEKKDKKIKDKNEIIMISCSIIYNTGRTYEMRNKIQKLKFYTILKFYAI